MSLKSILSKCLYNRRGYNVFLKRYTSLYITNNNNNITCCKISYNLCNPFSTCSVIKKNQQIISDEEKRKLQEKLKPKSLIAKTEKGSDTKSDNSDTILSEWTPIYRSNHIISARVFQRFKIFQTLLTIVVIAPISIKCYIAGIVGILPVYIAIGGSLFACAMLYVVGNFFSRFIGIIYVPKDENQKKTVRIARLNFWGNRVDEYVPINTIIPLSESVPNFNQPYLKLEQFSDEIESDYYYISLRYGSVLEPEEFENVFGICPER